MPNLFSNETPFSRLMLGTVQFGLPYGVANAKGQPSYGEVVDILRCAYEGGVNCLDTAAGYGESEAVLGRALAELGLNNRMMVVTKVAPLAANLSLSVADKLVEESVLNSLRALRLESLPLCLFHREENYCYHESLLKMKERGLVEQIGSSVMQPVATQHILDLETANVIQIPASLVDQRFKRTGTLRETARRGTTIFVRSIYLQGLLLMAESDIPEDLLAVIPLRRQLESLANETGITMGEMALRYMLSQQNVASIVIGVESVSQMCSNLELFEKGPLDIELCQTIDEIVPALSEDILLPNRWSSRMPDVKLASS